ncbi:hypothetical protein TNCV_1915101 [Trichonephila clavipes]|uniref:Uncharacterized protein n=1 Tax=Trichonephila clavipes TaxID=2585209 RepID=A0A8X6W060_TRICX|nr:hypothetical protein TNCV_1915101 [Trichonephila clavipes]
MTRCHTIGCSTDEIELDLCSVTLIGQKRLSLPENTNLYHSVTDVALAQDHCKWNFSCCEVNGSLHTKRKGS